MGSVEKREQGAQSRQVTQTFLYWSTMVLRLTLLQQKRSVIARKMFLEYGQEGHTYARKSLKN